MQMPLNQTNSHTMQGEYNSVDVVIVACERVESLRLANGSELKSLSNHTYSPAMHLTTGKLVWRDPLVTKLLPKGGLYLQWRLLALALARLRLRLRLRVREREESTGDTHKHKQPSAESRKHKIQSIKIFGFIGYSCRCCAMNPLSQMPTSKMAVSDSGPLFLQNFLSIPTYDHCNYRSICLHTVVCHWPI